jgi:hypothetical protein
MSVSETEILVKGKAVSVPSVCINGRTVLSTGKWLKLAAVRDEELVEGEPVTEPDSFVSQLKEAGLGADIFTFIQKLPDATPKYKYHFEWDNFAVIPITNFSDWWDHRVESSVRRAVRKATKSGVEVRNAEFDDALVRGIVGIHDESQIRQGKVFWHFQKSFETVKIENSTFPGRNLFLAAYHQDELIGFIRIIRSDKVANIIQLLSMMKHYDKRPANALIAKAVEVCEQLGMSHLTYCNYIYNDPTSSLTEFKRRSGFEQVMVPRYYIPLTLKGKIALQLGFHKGLVKRIPKPILARLLRIRSSWFERKTKAAKEGL